MDEEAEEVARNVIEGSTLFSVKNSWTEDVLPLDHTKYMYFRLNLSN